MLGKDRQGAFEIKVGRHRQRHETPKQVAKQFRGSDREEWFAATPPIEALRALISDTVRGPKSRALMVCDVSRAFFYAPVQHEIYVELCEEAKKTHHTTKRIFLFSTDTGPLYSKWHEACIGIHRQ